MSVRNLRTIDQMMLEIDLASGPDVMGKEDAYDFLQRIREEIQSRMEALRDELRDDVSTPSERGNE